MRNKRHGVHSRSIQSTDISLYKNKTFAMSAGNNASAQIANVFSNWSAKLQPLGSQVGKQFSQFQQYAKERMGTVGDITELPAEYRELEAKVDKIRLMTENLGKIARNYTLPHYDYEPALKDTVFDFATNVGDRATSLLETGAKAAGVNAPIQTTPRSKGDEIPPSLSHAFARVALHSAEELGTQEPIGAALKKFATVEERVGNARLKLDAAAQQKFVQPCAKLLSAHIAYAMAARKNVQSVRLAYDACRARLKASKPEHVEQVRQEMEAAEEEFVAAVDEAMGKMNAVVENPEPLKMLADLVAAQLAYFKESYEALSEVSPELDELQVTNESLLRHPSS
ncbi:hypothetical protein DFS34DRAFT_619480 [Phlyctochytrium arcticum]|nr:hypothetical protein DFS34DRAFT_636100 [Phlyctochytrium arcticum]KAI9098059.1 hypothetical protein DFS34DRAFT_619480 [Phlyctochytrium arcticum]